MNEKEFGKMDKVLCENKINIIYLMEEDKFITNTKTVKQTGSPKGKCWKAGNDD